jgi:cytochrome b subunit of formate dehydrogenase
MIADRSLANGRIAVYRHPLIVRVTHWVNALCLLMLLMSGLQILACTGARPRASVTR